MRAHYQSNIETPFGPVDGDTSHENWNIGLGAIRMRGTGFGFTIFLASARPMKTGKSTMYSSTPPTTRSTRV
jgi:hypothetical protein